MSAFKLFWQRRHLLALLMVGLLASLLLAACGDSTATGTTAAATTAAATTKAATTAAASATTAAASATTAAASATTATASATTAAATGGQPVTIRIATGDSGDGLAPYNKIKDEFEKANPDIKIKIEPVTDSDYYGSLLTQVASGKGPDLILVGDDAVAQFVKKGAFEDLTPYINGSNGGEKLDTSIFFPGVYQTGTYLNKPYVLTKDYTSICVLYNKELFKAANLPEPTADWTWEDFLATAQKLTIKDANGKITQYGVQLPAAWPRGFEAIAFSYGAKLISDDGTKYTGFLDSEAATKALQFYVDLYNKGYAPPPSDINKFLGGNDNFNQGTAAMQVVGHWPQSGYLKNPKLTDNLGVAGLPKGTVKANAIAWSGFGIYSKSANKAAAWKVLRYITGADGAKTWVDWGLSSVQSIAAQTKVAQDKIWADQAQYFKPITANSTPYWNDAGGPELSNAMQAALTDPNANVADLLKAAASKADKKLQEKIASDK
ncbi:MAG: sugar ABC transporter substrate-binding protein [Chloroflexota bacterium]